jgi:transcriptional regulator with XRE-family HTH domain
MLSNDSQHLRSRRRRASLTQADIAALLGVRKTSTVSRYERRGRLPDLETALAYEAIFGMPVAQLFPTLAARTRTNIGERARRLEAARSQTATGNINARRQRSIEELARP